MVARIPPCEALLSAMPELAAGTVPDDDLTLPQTHLAAPGTTADRTSLTMKNPRNGYPELRNAGENKVALCTDCGPVCRQTLHFPKRQRGPRVDVTRATFSPPLLHRRPRVGTATTRFTDPGGPN